MGIFDGIGGCAPRSSRSQPITVTLQNDGYGSADEEPDFLVVEKVEGAPEDVEWFQEDWRNCGVWLLDEELRGARRLVLIGRMYWERIATMEGDEFDGGFEVDEVRELIR